MMETFYDVKLNDDNFIKTSWMINISKKITEIPSLYIKAGAIHGCAPVSYTHLRAHETG